MVSAGWDKALKHIPVDEAPAQQQPQPKAAPQHQAPIKTPSTAQRAAARVPAAAGKAVNAFAVLQAAQAAQVPMDAEMFLEGRADGSWLWHWRLAGAQGRLVAHTTAYRACMPAATAAQGPHILSAAVLTFRSLCWLLQQLKHPSPCAGYWNIILKAGQGVLVCCELADSHQLLRAFCVCCVLRMHVIFRCALVLQPYGARALLVSHHQCEPATSAAGSTCRGWQQQQQQ